MNIKSFVVNTQDYKISKVIKKRLSEELRTLLHKCLHTYQQTYWFKAIDCVNQRMPTLILHTTVACPLVGVSRLELVQAKLTEQLKAKLKNSFDI